MEREGSFGKLVFISLFLLILAAAGILGGYYFIKVRPQTSVSTPPIIASPSPVTSLASPSPVADETPQIREAILKFTGMDPTRTEITVNKNTGQYATGSLTELADVGGGYWLAAKLGRQWVGVYAGQSQPKCSDIASYNFPREMVPECLDNTGKAVTR